MIRVIVFLLTLNFYLYTNLTIFYLFSNVLKYSYKNYYEMELLSIALIEAVSSCFAIAKQEI